MEKKAEQIRAAAKGDPGAVARAFQAVLVDFGYRVDAAYCEKQIEAYFRGDVPRGGPSMFIHSWLKDGME